MKKRRRREKVLSKKVAFSLILAMMMFSPLFIFADADSSAGTATVDGYEVVTSDAPDASGNWVLTITGYTGVMPDDLTIPSEMTVSDKVYKVTRIGEVAFKSKTMKSLTVPDTVTVISAESFENCSSLVTVHLGSGLTSIGDRAFKNCYSITEIHFKSSPELGKQSLCLGVKAHPVTCDLYGFQPTRAVTEDKNPYADVFYDEEGGEYTNVSYKEIRPDSRDSLIHIALIALGVMFLVFMGRSVKVKKIKRPKKKNSGNDVKTKGKKKKK